MVGVTPSIILKVNWAMTPGVGRVGGLTWAEDVEVAEADALESVGSVEGLDVVLAGELLDGVGR